MTKIKIDKILFFILLFPFIKSTYLSVTFPIIDKIYGMWIIFSFFCICILFVYKRYKSKICLLIFLYQFILVLSSIINKVEVMESIKALIKILAFCMIIDFGMKKNLKSTLEAILLILEIHIYINFITIIIFKDGMYVSQWTRYTENFFLGYDNLHILYIMPAILISMVYSYLYKNNKSIRTIFLYIISTLSIVIRWSATGLVAIFLFLLFVVFKKVIFNLKIFNITNYIITYLALFFSIVVFRLQNLFSYLIVDVLKKDLTFTNRTYVWDYTIDFIKNKPLFGYGIENDLDKLNRTKMYHTYHAHNQILEIFYLGGVFLAIVMLTILYSLCNKIKKSKDTYLKKLFSWFLFIYFIIMLTEAYTFDMIFFVFVIMYNIDYISKIKEEGKNE